MDNAEQVFDLMLRVRELEFHVEQLKEAMHAIMRDVATNAVNHRLGIGIAR